MLKINLRELSKRARQWDHPARGMLKYAEAMSVYKDVLKLPKRIRECYCVAMVTMAVSEDSGWDWWMRMTEQDPPDGLIMTLKESAPDGFTGCLREIEVVEHRDDPEKLFNTIESKLMENAYPANTVLVCLVLTPATYDFKKLAEKVRPIDSSVKHVFVIFAGAPFSEAVAYDMERLQYSSTLVQLLPVFEQITFDIRTHLADFDKRYQAGQESRLIEGDNIFFGTTNPKYSQKK